jgi:hypothetical protein
MPHIPHLQAPSLPCTRRAILADIAAEEEVLCQAFQFFDKDGNGEVSCAELRTTMAELGGLLSEQEIGAFAAIMDANNDGVISVGGTSRCRCIGRAQMAGPTVMRGDMSGVVQSSRDAMSSACCLVQGGGRAARICPIDATRHHHILLAVTVDLSAAASQAKHTAAASSCDAMLSVAQHAPAAAPR